MILGFFATAGARLAMGWVAKRGIKYGARTRFIRGAQYYGYRGLRRYGADRRTARYLPPLAGSGAATAYQGRYYRNQMPRGRRNRRQYYKDWW